MTSGYDSPNAYGIVSNIQSGRATFPRNLPFSRDQDIPRAIQFRAAPGAAIDPGGDADAELVFQGPDDFVGALLHQAVHQRDHRVAGGGDEAQVDLAGLGQGEEDVDRIRLHRVGPGRGQAVAAGGQLRVPERRLQRVHAPVLIAGGREQHGSAGVRVRQAAEVAGGVVFVLDAAGGEGQGREQQGQGAEATDKVRHAGLQNLLGGRDERP